MAEEENTPDIDAIQRRTEEIENEKERRQLEREERKFRKEHHAKMKQRERWVGLWLLLVTLVASYLIYLWKS